MSEIAPIDRLPGGLESGLEAVLMVADIPVSSARLAEIFEVPTARVAAALENLASEYDGKDRPRGFELRRVASARQIGKNLARRARPAAADFGENLGNRSARVKRGGVEVRD